MWLPYSCYSFTFSPSNMSSIHFVNSSISTFNHNISRPTGTNKDDREEQTSSMLGEANHPICILSDTIFFTLSYRNMYSTEPLAHARSHARQAHSHSQSMRRNPVNRDGYYLSSLTLEWLQALILTPLHQIYHCAILGDSTYDNPRLNKSFILKGCQAWGNTLSSS